MCHVHAPFEGLWARALGDWLREATWPIPIAASRPLLPRSLKAALYVWESGGFCRRVFPTTRANGVPAAIPIERTANGVGSAVVIATAPAIERTPNLCDAIRLHTIWSDNDPDARNVPCLDRAAARAGGPSDVSSRRKRRSFAPIALASQSLDRCSHVSAKFVDFEIPLNKRVALRLIASRADVPRRSRNCSRACDSSR